EPVRGGADALHGSSAALTQESLSEVFATLRSLRSFRHLALAAAFHSFGGYAFAIWGPTFFVRVHHMPTGQLGTWLGIVLGVGGAGLRDQLDRPRPRAARRRRVERLPAADVRAGSDPLLAVDPGGGEPLGGPPVFRRRPHHPRRPRVPRLARRSAASRPSEGARTTAPEHGILAPMTPRRLFLLLPLVGLVTLGAWTRADA